MNKQCWICEAEMVPFEKQVVMFDEVPILCSGWTCKHCGEIVLAEDEVDRVLKELTEARSKANY